MTVEKHSKLDIATRQLETAVHLYLGGDDRYSVITLAGAANSILTALVLKAGKEPFADYARRAHDAIKGSMPPRGKFMSHLNRALGINALKHMDQGDDEIVEFNIDKSSRDTVLIALSNYRKLTGKDEPFMVAFLKRLLDDTPPEERKNIMKAYENMPEKMKKGPKMFSD
jgi:hypothetical protein